MKRTITALLVIVCVLVMTISVSAIEMADSPFTGGNTEFAIDEFMYEGEPAASSPWSNAFCNENWTGCRWTAEKIGDIDCIKVVPVKGGSTCYMDFNWYQWNNDKYYPSLDCSKYKYLVVKYMLNSAALKTAGTSTFWASEDAQTLSTTEDTGAIDYSMSAKEADVWNIDIVDLSVMTLGDNPWSNTTIRQFRYYPFGSAAPATSAECYIEWMAFFGTEAEAKAYNGPQPPAIEVEVEEDTAEAPEVQPVEEANAAPAVVATQTFDVTSAAAVIAVLSAFSAAVVSKKKNND